MFVIYAQLMKIHIELYVKSVLTFKLVKTCFIYFVLLLCATTLLYGCAQEADNKQITSVPDEEDIAFLLTVNFRLTKNKVTMNFHPRHGTVIQLRKSEMQRLEAKWPNLRAYQINKMKKKWQIFSKQ